MPALLPGTHHHQLHAMLQQSRKRTTYHGKQVISNPLTILRHCNAGSSTRYSSSQIACHASAARCTSFFPHDKQELAKPSFATLDSGKWHRVGTDTNASIHIGRRNHSRQVTRSAAPGRQKRSLHVGKAFKAHYPIGTACTGQPCSTRRLAGIFEGSGAVSEVGIPQVAPTIPVILELAAESEGRHKDTQHKGEELLTADITPFVFAVRGRVMEVKGPLEDHVPLANCTCDAIPPEILKVRLRVRQVPPSFFFIK